MSKLKTSAKGETIFAKSASWVHTTRLEGADSTSLCTRGDPGRHIKLPYALREEGALGKTDLRPVQ